MKDEKYANLMIISVNLEDGKIEEVFGIEEGKEDDIRAALKQLGFPANETSDVETALRGKPINQCAFVLHTHSSPGCGYVYQDGSWRYVCRR
jgi:hypothetical protein